MTLYSHSYSYSHSQYRIKQLRELLADHERKYIHYFLFFMGFRYPFMNLKRYMETDIKSINDINDEEDYEKDNQDLQFRNIRFKFHLIWFIYIVFVLFLVLSEPIYIWYVIMTKPNMQPKMIYACFISVPALEYLISLNYFRTRHFDDTIQRIRHSKLTPIQSENTLLKCVFISLAFSLLLSFGVMYIDTYSFQQWVDYKAARYIDLVEDANGLFIVCMQIGSWVYARIALFLNMYIFIMVFSAHISEFSNAVSILKNRQTVHINNVRVSDLCYEFLKLKTRLENSIRYLQPVYTVGTFVGTIGLGILIEINNQRTHIEPFALCAFVLYGFVQCFFLYLMYHVDEQKEIISRLIQSPRFTWVFLQRHNMTQETSEVDPYRVLTKIKTKTNTHMSDLILYYCEITNASVDWMILNTILKEEWESFTFCGLTFHDGNAIQKAIAFSAMLLSMNNMMFQD